MRSLVDTNIWVYAHDARDAQKRERARAVLGADPGGLWTSPQVMGELYVTLTRMVASPMGAADARAVVAGLARLNVIPLEAAQVLQAADIAARYQLSYWDSLLIAAAQAARCDRLLTEDLQAGAVIAGVQIENPFAPSQRRLAETRPAYEATSAAWDDAGLAEELARYEQACRDTGMRPNAIHSYWDYARRFLAWRTGDYRPRGAGDAGRPVPLGRVTAEALEAQAAQYARVIEGAGREAGTVGTYHRHAMFFVRWLRGDFRPGGRLGTGEPRDGTDP